MISFKMYFQCISNVFSNKKDIDFIRGYIFHPSRKFKTIPIYVKQNSKNNREKLVSLDTFSIVIAARKDKTISAKSTLRNKYRISPE